MTSLKVEASIPTTFSLQCASYSHYHKYRREGRNLLTGETKMSAKTFSSQEPNKLSKYKNISVIKPKECIFCKSEDIIKWGFRFNHTTKKQRWKCNFCSKLFTVDDGFFHLHKKRELLTTCLDLYMNGLSLRKIRNHIKQFTEQGISHMQVWRWLIKYSNTLTNYTRDLEPQLSK